MWSCGHVIGVVTMRSRHSFARVTHLHVRHINLFSGVKTFYPTLKFQTINWDTIPHNVVRHTTFIKCTVVQGTFPLIAEKLLTGCTSIEYWHLKPCEIKSAWSTFTRTHTRPVIQLNNLEWGTSQLPKWDNSKDSLARKATFCLRALFLWLLSTFLKTVMQFTFCNGLYL